MFDQTRKLHREAIGRLRAGHRVTMLGAAVPASEEVERMGVERDPVAEFAPDSAAARAYDALWRDIARRVRVER